VPGLQWMPRQDQSSQANTGRRSRLRSFLERLGPYQSLATLAVPAATVEPMKLVAVAIFGKGYWFTGVAVIAAAYAASLLVVHRLFRIMKPKLLTLPWFAWLWERGARLWHRATRRRPLPLLPS